LASTQANYYKIYFEAVKPTTTNGGSVYIDNVKLVYF
jgi:hypothetical protein